jgi:hypothetical protein
MVDIYTTRIVWGTSILVEAKQVYEKMLEKITNRSISMLANLFLKSGSWVASIMIEII